MIYPRNFARELKGLMRTFPGDDLNAEDFRGCIRRWKAELDTLIEKNERNCLGSPYSRENKVLAYRRDEDGTRR